MITLIMEYVHRVVKQNRPAGAVQKMRVFLELSSELQLMVVHQLVVDHDQKRLPRSQGL